MSGRLAAAGTAATAGAAGAATGAVGIGAATGAGAEIATLPHIARTVQLSDGRLIVNPGSVGCPGFDYDVPVYHKAQAATPFASYAILEKTPRGWQPSFRLVRYDNLAMAELARRHGMMDWVSALSSGWIS